MYLLLRSALHGRLRGRHRRLAEPVPGGRLRRHRIDCHGRVFGGGGGVSADGDAPAGVAAVAELYAVGGDWGVYWCEFSLCFPFPFHFLFYSGPDCSSVAIADTANGVTGHLHHPHLNMSAMHPAAERIQPALERAGAGPGR